MAVQIKRLHGDRKRTVHVMAANEDGEVEQIDLAIWHRPLTPRLQEELGTIETEINAKEVIEPDQAPKPKKKELLVAQLAHVLTRWDVVGEDGEPMGPTAENIETFEYELLVAMKDAIFEPFYPKSTT